MTALDLEVTSLSGIDLDGAPPCEVLYAIDDPCGDPSVARIIAHCGGCGHTLMPMFTCAQHLDELTTEGLQHAYCEANVRGWTPS